MACALSTRYASRLLVEVSLMRRALYQSSTILRRSIRMVKNNRSTIGFYLSVLVFVGLIGRGLAEEDAVAAEPILCNPPKLIPDAEKAPLIYYSTDSRHCDKVRILSWYVFLVFFFASFYYTSNCELNYSFSFLVPICYYIYGTHNDQLYGAVFLNRCATTHKCAV
jgi:hypothetical protein